MNIMSKISKAINGTLDAFCVFLFVAMFILVVVQVVSRYFFNSPIPGTGELSQFMQIFLVFFGSVVAMRDGEHIQIDIITSIIPKKYHFIIFIFGKICVTVFMGILIFYGFRNAMNNMIVSSSVLGLNTGRILLSVPISAVLMLIYNIVARSKKEE